MQCTCMRMYKCLNIFVSFFCSLLHTIIEAKHSSPDYVQSLPLSLINVMHIFSLTENKQKTKKLWILFFKTILNCVPVIYPYVPGVESDP